MVRNNTRRRFNAKWARKKLRKYQRQGLSIDDAVLAVFQDAFGQAGISVSELQRLLSPERGASR